MQVLLGTAKREAKIGSSTITTSVVALSPGPAVPGTGLLFGPLESMASTKPSGSVYTNVHFHLKHVVPGGRCCRGASQLRKHRSRVGHEHLSPRCHCRCCSGRFLGWNRKIRSGWVTIRGRSWAGARGGASFCELGLLVEKVLGGGSGIGPNPKGSQRQPGSSPTWCTFPSRWRRSR